MPFSAPRAVDSGRQYRIIPLDDHLPADPDEFLGETRFAVDLDGTPYVICGAGTMTQTGVHVHQKDADGTGKDIRVWAVHQDPDPGPDGHRALTAEHSSPSVPPTAHRDRR